MKLNQRFEEDLDFILKELKEEFKKIKNEKIFITGGTGFFGKWFLGSILRANEKLNTNIKIGVLSRNPEKFKKNFPYLSNEKYVNFYKGDIRNFDFPNENFSYIIHGASASAEGWFKGENQIIRIETITAGTKRILDFAKKNKIKGFLYMSSGKVYGTHSDIYEKIPEYYCGNLCLEDPNAALSIGKKMAEFLALEYSKNYNIPVKIARGFAFVGPYLQLNLHYAVGNFIRDALKGGPIVINGDGKALRSYLYAADAIIWFFKILINSKNRSIYNVGSENIVSIKEVAELINSVSNKKMEIRIQKKEISKKVDQYIPSTKKIKEELGVREYTSLKDAIIKTIDFYRKEGLK
ncbi:NAD-dependent epimerase/dehydratase family protein [Marinitoga sp. 1155]|uniref:NAD-dependent epimerase/dehydratase family protein n=1 Tax=Marinitoga sp. 1155 TaxID=1428448 RepID=UPI000641609D|nr:NAD(P)-dependent oxidoreductase [Marinitoga sp. 1155]KLO21687.1 epimerase [Marinitoga sp. 1155]